MKKFIRLILSAVVIFSNFSMHVKAEAKNPRFRQRHAFLLKKKPEESFMKKIRLKSFRWQAQPRS